MRNFREIRNEKNFAKKGTQGFRENIFATCETFAKIFFLQNVYFTKSRFVSAFFASFIVAKKCEISRKSLQKKNENFRICLRIVSFAANPTINT